LNKNKIINDPVYGFITIPNALIFDLIEHPFFQRMRHIRQLGLSHYVYPGALHTRFHHALGAMHITSLAVDTLRHKGHVVTKEEERAVLIAILLHDIGHGPYSHALESSLVKDVPHETMSLIIMHTLNAEFNGQLTMAIEIFTDNYPKKFLHQLVSSQLDMDRLDYLGRDSFFTGVSEGIISVDRILKMLNVNNDQLVVDEKGIYSIEKFIVARRLMYWQVYLHKTVLAAENQLINILKRARTLVQQGETIFMTTALSVFLKDNYTRLDFENNPTLVPYFCKLDDTDIFSCIKEWENCNDFILAHLCGGLVHRNLYKIFIDDSPIDQMLIAEYTNRAKAKYKIDESLSSYFVFKGEIENNAYSSSEENIKILYSGNNVKDMAHASDSLSIKALSKAVVKYYCCVDRSLLHKDEI
jgi:HD superfamily phosphohydrolase